MSWEDVLKRGRVPPRKPTKKTPDTSWRNELPEKEEVKPLPEPENIVDQIVQDSEREALAADFVNRDEERRNRPRRYSLSDEEREKRQRDEEWDERRAREKRIKAAKRAGTHRPVKGQQRNKNPRAQTPKKTRSQRKAANEAKKRREAQQSRDARQKAARDARDRRRGL